MEGFMTFTGLIMIAFGILQIILFFKLWGMTNNVKRILKKVSHNKKLTIANVLFLKGDIEEVEKFLNESFLEDVSNNSMQAIDHEEWEMGYNFIVEKYTKAFEKIGKPAPDFKKYGKVNAYLFWLS